MTTNAAAHVPRFCPNPGCSFHTPNPLWRFRRQGVFYRKNPPYWVRRFRCDHCGRNFSTQTFKVTYWLKRPQFLVHIFHGLLGCSSYRQIARHYKISPTTVLTHAARLGRHCQLFHELHRPKGLPEPVALDGFQSFEFSQYTPVWFHVVAGKDSHFFYGFTDSELRRSGSMRPEQKARRAELEEKFGRPDPRSIEREVESLLRVLATEPQSLELDSDDHHDYPRAIRRLRHLAIRHTVTSSKARRTSRNPLFAINLLDLLIRHSGANHKRETIAFSKRRQSAAERLWCFLVWRNYLKSFSERKRDASPAMRLKILDHLLSTAKLFRRRLFPSHIRLPQPWLRYYHREVTTRRIPHCAEHRLRFAI